MDGKAILTLRIPLLLERAADHSKLGRLDEAEEVLLEILRQLELQEESDNADLQKFLKAWHVELQKCILVLEEEDHPSLYPWANAAYQIAKKIKKEEAGHSRLLQGIWNIQYPKIPLLYRGVLTIIGILAVPIGLGIFLWILYNLIFGFSQKFTNSAPGPFQEGVFLFLRIMGGFAWSIFLMTFGFEWLRKGIVGKNTEQPIYEFHSIKNKAD